MQSCCESRFWKEVINMTSKIKLINIPSEANVFFIHVKTLNLILRYYIVLDMFIFVYICYIDV